MSHFSQYQFRHIKRLFVRFSETRHDRLTIYDLNNALMLIGPELPIVQIKRLIYRYDTSCEGTLLFDDFLELLSDYEVTLTLGREMARKSLEHFVNHKQTRMGINGLNREDIMQVLQLGGHGLTTEEATELCEEFFSQYVGESLLSEHRLLSLLEGPMKEPVWEISPPFPEMVHLLTNKSIIIRVQSAWNLAQAARVKLRRKSSLHFETLDPLVSISCCGVTKETSVLFDAIEAKWEQELNFPLHFPYLDSIHSVQEFVEKQEINFNLYDYITMGVTPHLQWLGSASIPLSIALETTDFAATMVLSLSSPMFSVSNEPIMLEVSLHTVDYGSNDGEREAILSARPNFAPLLVDFFITPDDLWLMENSEKLARNLSQDIAPDLTLFEHVRNVWNDMKAVFPRRKIRLLALDEYNVFHVMPAFIQPISCSLDCLYTPPPELGPTSVSHLTRFATTSLALSHIIARIPSSMSFISSQDTNTSSSKFIWVDTDPVASPAVVLDRLFASPLERACLLCSLFLGIGINSYVAFGMRHGQSTIWVVTIEPIATVLGPYWVEKMKSLSLERPTTRDPLNNFLGSMTSIVLDDRSRTGSNNSLSNNAGTGVDPNLVFDYSKFHASENMEADASVEHDVRMNNSTDVSVSDTFSNVGAIHWDPSTGSASTIIDSGEWIGDQTSYDEVYSLVNHLTIFVNVQQTAMVNRTDWQVTNTNSWFPLTNIPVDPTASKQNAQSMLIRGGTVGSINSVGGSKNFANASDAVFSGATLKVVPAYSPPSTLFIPRAVSRKTISETSFINKLVVAIQLYRRDKLFIPNTVFFRPICRFLQSNIDLLEVSTYNDNNVSRNDNVDKEWEKMQLHLSDLLPPHTLWYGIPYHFAHSDVESIVEQLSWTGILDSSVPGTAMAIGGKIYSYAWGLCSVWVNVGYLNNIDKIMSI